MADRRRSYVIVTSLSGTGRPWRPARHQRRRGRHRLGTPGTTPRYPAGPPRQGQPGRRARPRRAARPADLAGVSGLAGMSGLAGRWGCGAHGRVVSGDPPAGPWRRRGRPRHGTPTPARLTRATRCGGLVLLLGTLAASGWFTFSGAAAFAQMIQP